MYYLLIGGGLALAGLSQNLGMSLCVCAAGTLLCAPRKAVQSTRTA